MQRTALLLTLTATVLAQPPQHGSVLFHGSLVAGSVNKDSGGHQFWCEAEFWNGSSKPATVTLTVRRRLSGQLLLHASYPLAPHEKRTVRIDDPGTNVSHADADSPIPEAVRATFLATP